MALREDVVRAVAFVRDRDHETVDTQIELSQIPAPPFAEDARAERMAELFAEAGLRDVRRDRVGNVIADRPGAGGTSGTTGRGDLVVTAHLDTVFPAGTDVSVRRLGDRLEGPGISDDARGLAALLTVARCLAAGGVETEAPLRFVATVGEEGAGDLRGVKHLFGPAGAGTGASAFISLDGAGLERIVVRGLGSRRYRVTVRGPGGHSWVDWGTPNPIHALTVLGARLATTPLPEEPLTTLTVSRIGGGTSINAIPQSAWLEIDTRSASAVHLADVESVVRRLANEHAAIDPRRGIRPDAEGGASGHAVPSAGRLQVDIEVIGDRPAGETDPGHPLVQAAIAATRSLRGTPLLAVSSTDANIPMSVGIPAVTLGCGGEAGLAHTTAEWYRNVNGPEGILRALHTVLLFAGVP